MVGLVAQGSEIELLASREDSCRNLVAFGGCKDPEHVGRRLFDALEQGVECRFGEHVDLVHHHHPVAIPGRPEPKQLLELADLVHAGVGGGIDLHHIDARSIRDLATRGTHAAGLGGGTLGAVHRLGEQSRRRGLADPAQTREQIGVAERIR